MAITSTAIVVSVWIGTGALALAAVGYAGWQGWRGKAADAVAWREAKVLGTVAGVVGLLAAMLAFEKTIREFNQDAEKYLMERFLELKFDTTYASAIACAGDQSQQEARLACVDFKNIDKGVNFAALDFGKPFTKFANWQRNPALDPLIAEVSRAFDDLNGAIAIAREKPIIGFGLRVLFGIGAILLIVVALACALGEAMFQLRQERERRAAQATQATS